MPSIIVKSCGCSITRDMFSDRRVLDVSFCQDHKDKNPQITAKMLEMMKEIEKEEKGKHDK